jgi:hypothetical protein
MNKTVNQSGETIITVGQKGSHIRNKEEYNITLPKLIEELKRGVVIMDRLKDICIQDNVPKEEISGLVRSAVYYYENPKRL